MNIVITGASKGLGKAFASAFANNGNTLLLCARNLNDLETTAKELSNNDATIHYKLVDVSIKNEVVEFANWCLHFGVPDIIINNAGSFLPGSVYNEENGVIEKMIETNLYSAYHLTRNLLPQMMQKKQGHIFNICSIASIQAYSNGGSYSISKFAMLGFSKNLREEMKPFNIKVTSVLPGAVFCGSWKGSGVDENRIMKDDDIAKMVYAASQLSPQACVEEIILRPQLGDL
ncbi:MAG: SDR family oxidoreductase [Chitinophagaceae bacterium]